MRKEKIKTEKKEEPKSFCERSSCTFYMGELGCNVPYLLGENCLDVNKRHHFEQKESCPFSDNILYALRDSVRARSAASNYMGLEGHSIAS